MWIQIENINFYNHSTEESFSIFHFDKFKFRKLIRYTVFLNRVHDISLSVVLSSTTKNLCSDDANHTGRITTREFLRMAKL